MFRTFILLLVVLISASTFSQTITRLDNSRISASDLDKKIEDLISKANVQGIAVSVFNNNQPVYSKTFGYKKFETKEPLKPTTNIYGASLSKAVFAVMVLRLVEQGVINLDKPLQQYLDSPIYLYKPHTRWHDNYADLKNDSSYKKITARMALSHTSGFPNWRWDNPDQKLRTSFTPGTKYMYSGEGMVYLQVVLEKMLKQPLDSMMNKIIFRPLGMKHSAYYWKPEFETDYAWGHNSQGKTYEKDKDNEPRSASTLETTLEDYTLFTKGVLNKTIISSASTKLMFTPILRLKSVQQFGPSRFRDTTLYDNIQLSNGLGWIILKSPYGTGALKEGHGDGFQHYIILFPDKGTGILIMTNSDNGESIFKELLEYAIGDIYTPWYWENYIPYDYKK